MDNPSNWIGVVMATLALIGVTVERVINFLKDREKGRNDTQIALATAVNKAKVETLETQNGQQADQIATLKDQVGRCQIDHKEALKRADAAEAECDKKHEAIIARVAKLEGSQGDKPK